MLVIKYPAYPIVIATSKNTFVLDEVYQVKNIRIPKNFESDGLTLKIRLLRLVVSKYSPKFMPFFLVHDYLTDQEKYKFADDIGEEVLYEIEKSWRTKSMMKLIRIYHKIKYRV